MPRPETKRDQLEIEEFWRVATPEREPFQVRAFRWGVVLILAVATPWYLPDRWGMRILAGLPVWVWVALSAAFLLAVLSSFGALVWWRDGVPVAPTEPKSEKGPFG